MTEAERKVPGTLAEALVDIQARLPEIKKGEKATVKNDQGKFLYSYNYADLAGVSKAVLPLLAEVGLSFSAKPTLNAEGKFVLAYRLLHVSKECDEGQYPLPTSGTPQQIGGAITYARRYCLCAVTGVAPEADDDDAAAASRQQEEQPSEQGRQRTAQRRQRATTNGAPANGQARERATAEPPALPDGQTHERPSEVRPNLTDLHAAFTRLRVKDRDDGLAIIAEVAQRPVGSSKELTQPELVTLVDKLSEVARNDEPELAVAELVENGRAIQAHKAEAGP